MSFERAAAEAGNALSFELVFELLDLSEKKVAVPTSTVSGRSGIQVTP